MVSCYYCVFHKIKGAAHTCDHCKNKVVYGEMQEKFLIPCLHFKITENEIMKRKLQVENERPFTRRTMQVKKWRNKK